MICKSCKSNDGLKKYRGLCAKCRYLRYGKIGKCIDCGKTIDKKGTRCMTCNGKFHRNRVIRTCQLCGKVYETKESIRLKFCSSKCALIVQSKNLRKGGKHSPRWTGKDSIQKDGYVTRHCPRRKRRVYVHILIAEEILGRPLRKKEMVHHINLNKSDNRHSNLLICDLAYHGWLHHAMALAWVNEHILKEAH